MIAFAVAQAKKQNFNGFCPVEVQHLWVWYVELTRTRQAGLVANPITNSEIKAWKELNDIETTPWEVSVLIRLDNAVLAKQNINTTKGGHREADVEIEASDARGVMGMMQRLGAKLGITSG